MAAKRALSSSIPCAARVLWPVPARGSRALILAQRRRHHQQLPHLPISLTFPSSSAAAVRLFHGIPRPRDPTVSTQQDEQEQQQRQQDTLSSSSSSTAPSTPSPEHTSEQATPTTHHHDQQQQPTAATPSRPNVTQQPHYELTFTCRPCGTRSRHRVSKQGYHHGSVLIACPECRNRHVIADHLRIFGDTAMTVEQLLRERGELVKRGTLGEDGDVEFWEDGSTSVREPWADETRGEGEVQGGGEADADALPGSTFKNVKPGDGERAQS